MWEPRPLTPLWAFTACYRDSFTFFLDFIIRNSAILRWTVLLFLNQSLQKLCSMAEGKILMRAVASSCAEFYLMVIYGQNYWALGLFPSLVILKTKKHNVSETGSISVLR
jgi:hypothetical protein